MPSMTDKQKAALKKHMDAYKGDDKKSHRMKMMARMLKGMSVKKAHSDIGKSTFATKNKGKKNAKNPVGLDIFLEAMRDYNRDHPAARRVSAVTNPTLGGLPIDLIGRNGVRATRYLVNRDTFLNRNLETLPAQPPQRQNILNRALFIAQQPDPPLPPLPNNNNNNDPNNNANAANPNNQVGRGRGGGGRGGGRGRGGRGGGMIGGPAAGAA